MSKTLPPTDHPTGIPGDWPFEETPRHTQDWVKRQTRRRVQATQNEERDFDPMDYEDFGQAM